MKKWMKIVYENKKIVTSLENAGLLIKDISERVQNEAKEQKHCWFLGMLLGTLGTSLYGNLLTGRAVKVKTLRRGVIRASEGTVKAS